MTSLLAPFQKLATPSSMRQLWGYLKSIPGGGKIMGALVGRMAPYTGTIRPEIVALDMGYSKVLMRDTRRVRNHLNSLHAIALMNLGEVSTGTAMMYSLPDNCRAIIVNLSMDYVKKGRGPITAECTCPVPQSNEKKELEVHGELKNEAGELVARAHARWLIGPA